LNRPQQISNGILAVGRLLRLAQASSPSLIDDGIRPLIQIAGAFLLDGFKMTPAAWHDALGISSRA
jgi:hypothetical protein